ncbi:hypothetical protein K503DRAFT_199408 [Rhizopogon vinicolor AM-OR11-026]|uniref:Uncharacterized protein n=1 Tax=Rhizopogon vinicolor AM-OR11-026 TaxID=1314800 RepID=A0A1B7NEN3_9AGAM|nr:hypothetical protein K503DRAFT_199408 [Rhizopogon vinicolor AM-OR11-026]
MTRSTNFMAQRQLRIAVLVFPPTRLWSIIVRPGRRCQPQLYNHKGLNSVEFAIMTGVLHVYPCLSAPLLPEPCTYVKAHSDQVYIGDTTFLSAPKSCPIIYRNRISARSASFRWRSLPHQNRGARSINGSVLHSSQYRPVQVRFVQHDRQENIKCQTRGPGGMIKNTVNPREEQGPRLTCHICHSRR